MWKKKLGFTENSPVSVKQTTESGELRKLKETIAELERRQRKLQRTEEIYRQLFHKAPIGAVTVTATGEIVNINNALCSLLGYNETELQGKNLQILVNKADVSALSDRIAKLTEDKSQVSQVEFRVQHKQGNFVWANWIGSNVYADAKNGECFVFQLQTISHRKRAEKRFALSTMHDQATGLPNRVLLMERLQAAFSRAKLAPDASKFTVMFLEVDRVELLNSELSPEIGDRVQVEIARRLESFLRTSDTVAKLSNHEFAVLLEQISTVEEAIQIAERFQKALSKPLNDNGQEMFANLSIGIAIWSPDYELPGLLLRDAAAALQQAKRNGKGRYEVFNSEIHQRAVYLQLLENDLRQALERREFCLYFQPVLDLRTCHLRGLEALLRWQHPKIGQISPMEFIPIAEEADLINPIGTWVLREACRQLAEWKTEGTLRTKIWLSVNVSSKQLMEPGFVAEIKDILTETKVAPYCLKLEITESAMINNIETAIRVLSDIKKLGVQISVDDFGTGYSSLSNIHRLPVDIVKIDRSFLMNTTANTENWEIINSIITLAGSLNLEVVAEGVETGEQVVRLQNLGCLLGQGYYFAHPLEVHAVGNLLSELQQTDDEVIDEMMLEYFDNVAY